MSPARQIAEMKRQVEACLRAAIEAVEPSALVAESLRGAPLGGRPTDVYLLAVGKASLGMLRGALEVLDG